jgi:GH15 family glucan-1,4-alpha-glucosidase
VRSSLVTFVFGVVVVVGLTAESAPSRSFFSLPSSNGHGAVMVDARTAKVVHFREHLPATEEFVIDDKGNDVWVGNEPQVVRTRNFLYDAYFGLRANGQQRWLTLVPDSSGYVTAAPSPRGGSGVITWSQRAFGLDVTTYVFAPRALAHASFVMAVRVRNPGPGTATNVGAFSLHNLHLGKGRPGVMQTPEAAAEAVIIALDRAISERGFAGVVVARGIGSVARSSAWNAASQAADNAFLIVDQGSGNLVDRRGTLGLGDDWATALQFDHGALQGGDEFWSAVVMAHEGDPFADAKVLASIDAYVAGRGAKALVDAEVSTWEAFQQSLVVPSTLTLDEAAVFRQSAVVLEMAQVRSSTAFVREWRSRDGEARFTRFPTIDGGALPNVVRHRGAGAVLASLPPGEWTYAWIRDGAYAVSALSAVGRKQEARDALRFFLEAEGGRFKDWSELRPYSFPPYLISLTRYVGFGVEETDFNAFGPNLEFDGFGLFLWALRQYERRSGDESLADEYWERIATRVADPLVALVDPGTGLLRKDSSIWETHWNGRERTWTFTNITAARGLCDAAALAERLEDEPRALLYRQTAQKLRRAIAQQLTDDAGALASNREELLAKTGYFDAAVWEAIALGLFDPQGRIARATRAGLDGHLRSSVGPGWSRNDDRGDHLSAVDLSPWGSEYDSAEWVFTDMRGSLALGLMREPSAAGALDNWLTAQASANAGLIPETFDEKSGAWKFNAPMVGFGAGVYVLALAQRAGGEADPACGQYFEALPPASELDAGPLPSDGGAVESDAGLSSDGGAEGDGGTGGDGAPAAGRPVRARRSCGCTSVDAWSTLVVLAGVSWRRRRRES